MTHSNNNNNHLLSTTYLCACVPSNPSPSAWNSFSLLVHLLHSYFAFQNLTQVLFFSQDISLASPDSISLSFQYFDLCTLLGTSTFALPPGAHKSAWHIMGT